MRDLKFRAWHKDAKKMLHFHNPHFNVEYRFFCFDCLEVDNDKINDLPGGYGRLFPDDNIGTYLKDTQKLEQWHVMQYTGLRDKNGKEIYEGDIVRFDSSERPGGIGSIAFESNGYYFGYMVEHGKNAHALFSSDTYEVLGNIHENPDLKPHE